MLTPSLTSIDTIHQFVALQTRREQDRDAVAKQMEGMFASVLLKTMRQTVGGEGLFPGDSADVMGSMFDQFMGDHIAKNGNLGIADAFRSQL